MAHCNACDLELDPGADRCPKCLRKSTLAAESDGDHDNAHERGSSAPSWVVQRAGVALSAIALGAVGAWQAFAHEAWLEGHHVWIAVLVVCLGLVTMPLRVAFRMPSEARTGEEALRFYARATLAVDGFILLLGVCVAGAALALDGPIAGLVVGVVAFFALLVATPVVIVAVRRPSELSKTAARAGKQALALAGVLVAGTVLVALRAGMAHEPTTIVLAEDPKALLDPMDLEHVTLRRRTTRNADGTTTRHLVADGIDMKRTLLKLDVAAFGAIDESKKDPTASGLVTCWVPARLRTPESESELAKEQERMQATLASGSAKTPSGRAVRVIFDFGEPPG